MSVSSESCASGGGHKTFAPVEVTSLTVSVGACLIDVNDLEVLGAPHALQIERRRKFALPQDVPLSKKCDSAIVR